MRRVAALLSLVMALPLVLPASEFDWMVREFSRQSSAKQTRIPFFGLERLAVVVAHPAGTSELNLAVFEHSNMRAEDFSRLADGVSGTAWRPMIRVRSRSGESTNIYVRPDGRHLKVLVATLDGAEATFVELRVQPESLMKFVDEHRRDHLE